MRAQFLLVPSAACELSEANVHLVRKVTGRAGIKPWHPSRKPPAEVTQRLFAPQVAADLLANRD